MTGKCTFGAIAGFLLLSAVPLMATLTYTPALPIAGQTVTFTLLPTNGPNDPTRPNTWDFGDGTVAQTSYSILNATHAYASPGTYRATVTYYYVTPRGVVTYTDDASITVAAPNRLIVFSPAHPMSGETITFQAQNFLTPNAIAWNFGDGAMVASGGSIQTHIYSEAGTYVVQARDQGGSAAPTTVTVTVVNTRRLDFTPFQPNVGETVTFTAQSFLTPFTIAWDFGDGGAVGSGASTQTHVFNAPGTYLVQARDRNGQGPTLTATVPVVNKRRVLFSPVSPKTGQAVQFQAVDFTTACVRWDFGDGTVAAQGTPTQAHTYVKPGSFVVTATDNCGSSTWSASTSVLVLPTIGPLTEFAVTYGILRFESGKTNIMVAKNTAGLDAFADLKYEGTGALQVEWRVDGQPFKSDSTILSFGQQTTLTSGKMPGLPTLVPGTHTVEFIIRKPAGAITLPPIVYTVSAAVLDQSPVVEKVSPSDLSIGLEQELILEGKNLTSGTTVSFGLGVGIVHPLQLLAGGKAKLKVFVSPTAKGGSRQARASNSHGTNTGPGSIYIAAAPLIVQPPAITCTDINTIPHFEITLKSPSFYQMPPPSGYEQQGGQVVPKPPSGEIKINVPTVDDFIVLRWALSSHHYDYLEVRFFRPSSTASLIVRKLDGTATSLPLSGDVLAELFNALKPSAYPTMQQGYFSIGGYAVVNDAIFGGQGESSWPPSEEDLFAQGVAKGADIAWQVAGFSVYPCVYDAKKPGQKSELMHPVEEAASPKWLFNLPNSVTGLDCAAATKKAKAAIQALNLTAGERDQNNQTPGLTSNANFVGDRIELQGSFTLAGSPYGTHVVGGNSLKVQNLFLDWGDGSPASPVLIKVQGGGSWKKDSVVVLQNSLWGNHKYQSEGNFTIRLFQLSEDDIQSPASDFYAALGDAVFPQSAGTNPYKTVLDAGLGPNVNTEASVSATPSEPDPLAAALPRAYLIYCHTLKISHYGDECAAGPLHLTALEIMNFPGHDVIVSGQQAQNPEGGVMINPSLLTLYYGIHAVAVVCDKALIGRARLRYFGSGSVEVTWIVDGKAVQTATFELASEERANLSPGQSADCAQPLLSDLVFTSQPFSVAVLGKHTVRVKARVVASYTLANLSGTAKKAVSGLGAKKAILTAPEAGPGPSAEALSTGAFVGGSYDPWLAQLAADQKEGQAVPQIGFLSPGGETNGRPAVVYLNDAIKDYSPPPDVGPASPFLVVSEDKAYQINEVRDVKFCQIIFPTAGGDFIISDLGSSIQIKGAVYDGVGTLIYKVRTSGGAVLEKYAAGSAFKDWAIEESSGRVQKGSLDAVPPNAETLFLPAHVHGTLRRLQGQVDGSALQPLSVRFDLTVQGAQGAFLLQASGDVGKPPEWKNIAGALDTQGNWIASNLAMGAVGIGKTGFSLSASAVTVDFSVLAAPVGAQGPASAAGWTGIYLGGAVIDPYTFDLSGGALPLTMTNLEPWLIAESGLSGKARSSGFSAKIQETALGFNHLEFVVAGDAPNATFYQCAIHVPWIGAVLKGNAVMQLISQSAGYGINWTGLTADPVTVSYTDKGRISLTVSDLVWGRDTRGWKARGKAAVTAETENKTFASFVLNGINFGADGRAYFDGPSWSQSLGLSGNSHFGEATAALQSVTAEASGGGADRLAFHIAAQVSLSPDSNFIPASDVQFHYLISRPGSEHVLTGPWNSEFTTKVVFPLGSQEIDSAVSPNYDGAGADPAAFAESFGATAGPAAGPARGWAAASDMRFSGAIDMGIMGGPPVKGAFVLGYKNGKSFFLLFVKYDSIFIPLSPVPLAIQGIGGGFAYNFAPEVFRNFGSLQDAQPDLAGDAVFAAVLTVGTSDKYTIMADGYFTLSTAGSAEMGFTNAKLMQMGNFSGYINYYSKNVTGKVWGELDLLGGLINFNLGADEQHAAIDLLFGAAGWHVYAGRYEGPRITAKVWLLNCSSYLQLDNNGLKVGGSNQFYLGAGAVIIKGYVKSWMDIGLGIHPDPFYVEGSWEQGVAAGGCLDIGIKELCLELSVTASIYARAPDPTVIRASASLDFGVKTVTIIVEL